jgi:hypothetical protein
MKMKKIPEFKVSKKLEQEFTHFLETHPAKRVNRGLRVVWMHFLENAIDGVQPKMDDMIFDIGGLMELLDVAQDETEC